jgi:hypothetical protein
MTHMTYGCGLEVHDRAQKKGDNESREQESHNVSVPEHLYTSDLHSQVRANPHFTRLSPPGACKPTPMTAKARDIPTKPSDIRLLANLRICE